MTGGFQYKDSHLQFFPHAEGYVNASVIELICMTCRPAAISYTTSYDYVFNYTDHLGNIRLSYTVDPVNGDLKVLEENHYYPFGLKHTNYNSDVLLYSKNSLGTKSLRFMPPVVVEPSYNYKYNGKEYQDELGLNMYDYGARNYDPAIGRWMNIDPLAENSRRWTPYNYAYNNPMFFVDPDGMQADDWVKKGNKVFYDSRVTNQATAIKYHGTSASWKKDGYSYVANTGDKITLKHGGVFTLNGEPMQSPDVSFKTTTTDGTRVFGYGGDVVAGSGIINNDRGSGSIEADNPAGDVGMLYDLGQLIGGLVESNPLYIVAKAILSSDQNSNESTMSSDTNSEPKTVNVERQNWSATPPLPNNPSVLHKGVSTILNVTEGEAQQIEKLNKADSLREIEKRDSYNSN